MTRFLEKYKKTQVNSNLIGVQLRPAPPVITAIYADVVDNTAECDDTDEHKLFVATINGFDVIMIDGAGKSDFGNYLCYVYDIPFEPESEIPEGCPDIGTAYVTAAGDHQPEECVPGTVLYTEDAEGNLTEGGEISYGLEAGSFVRSGTDYFGNGLYTEDYDGDDLYEIILYYNNSYMIHIDSFGPSYTAYGNVKGILTNEDIVTDEDLEFEPDGSSDNYYVWKSGHFGDSRLFYTLTESPSVGDKLYYNKTNSIPDSNKYYSLITDVEETDEPLECVVEYSVDGELWSTWPEVLDADNNVIANIPRYMYLRFSEDVVITEE